MTRKTVIMDDDLWEVVRSISFMSKKSISQIVREALKDYIDKRYPAIERYLSLEYVDEDEEEELLKALSQLSKEDLKVAERKEI